MAEITETTPVERDPAETAGHDGRFGKRFDDEVSVSSVVWMTIGLAVACVLGMLITWGMWGYFAARSQVPPSPIAEAAVHPMRASGATRRLPEIPLLQRDPEAELEAMRHEVSEQLGGYGWIDQGAGTVHIPIDKAISLLVEHGSVAVGGEDAAAPAAGEGTGE